MNSFITHWPQLPAEPTKTGQRRGMFKQETGTLKQMSMHATTLNPGEKAHEPHQHPDEEMIILKDGTLEAIHSGRTEKMEAGSVLFIAPNDLHGVRNCGDVPATYYVLRWLS